MNGIDLAARGLAMRALGMQGRTFATKIDAQAALAPLALGSIFATQGGLAVADGGAATYCVVADEPAHPGKIALANGFWGEIVGPELPVEAFGAVADCPDVSGYHPATQQAAIVAGVSAATNDAQAFQDAFKAAKAIGGGIVTYGHGKRYRIAFDHLGVFALVVGDNTTLRRVGGGWLAFDPSLLTGERPSYPDPPQKRSWPDPGITTGFPETGYATTATLLAETSNVIPADAGVDETDFVGNVHFENVDIRCHTRVYWHALADQSSPTYRRLRLYGFYARFVRGATWSNCYVKGMPNDGFNVAGLDYSFDEDCKAELCGYGGVIGTAQNGLSAIGYVIQGRPDLSGQNVAVRRFTSRYAKDEGVAFAGIKSLFIDTITSVGDHDRAIEGIDGYAMTETSASIGQDIANDVTVSNVSQDGRHVVGTGSIVSGGSTLALDDAFYLTADGAGGRYVFIPGAGPGGGDGPFLISSVDYVANTVTLATTASANASDVECYVYSRVVATASDGNEGRVTFKSIRAKNVYAVFHPILLQARSGGRFHLEDVELENVTVKTNFHAVSLEGERVTAKDIRVIGSAGPNSAVLRTKATYAKVVGVQADSGFLNAVVADSFSGPAKLYRLTGCDIEGSLGSAVRLYYGVKCDRIIIEDNYFGGVNASANASDGVVLIDRAPLISGELLSVCRNTARWAGRQTTYPITTSGPAMEANFFKDGCILDNDFMDPDLLGMQPANSVARPLNRFVMKFMNLIVRNNAMPGSRVIQDAPIPPATGRWYQGDEIRAALPMAGAPERARCTIGGNYAPLFAADGVTSVTVNGAVTSSSTVVVSDSTNIRPNDTLVFNAGANTRVVAWVDQATHTLTLTAALTASNGASVANTTPAFKTSATLAA